MVTVPTRKRGSDRSTMLDLIITKQPDKITDIDIRSPLGSSDHATIYFNIITEPKNIKREKIVYFYNKGNYIGGGIYDIWYPNPQKIATKGFSTDLISIGCQY